MCGFKKNLSCKVWYQSLPAVYFRKRTAFTSASPLPLLPRFFCSIPPKDWFDIEMENRGACVFLLSKTHTCMQRPEPPESGVVTSVQRAGSDAGKAIQHNTAALSASSLTHFPLPGFLPFFFFLFLFKLSKAEWWQFGFGQMNVRSAMTQIFIHVPFFPAALPSIQKKKGHRRCYRGVTGNDAGLGIAHNYFLLELTSLYLSLCLPLSLTHSQPPTLPAAATTTSFPSSSSSSRTFSSWIARAGFK